MMRRMHTLALVPAFWMMGCGERGPSDVAGAVQPAPVSTGETAVAAPPPVPASSRIQGVWRYAPPEGSVGPTIEIEFGPDGMRRSVNGRHEVLVPYAVGEEGSDFVGLDVPAHGGAPAGRHRWRLLEGDRLVHEAAPRVIYVREPALDPAPAIPTSEGSR